MQRRSFLIAAGSTALARPAAAAVEDIAWTDPARSRTLPLRVRWPDGNAPCALVLHSHGLGGNREGGDAWGRAWRDAGIAVIHLQHPGSDLDAVRGRPRALQEAASAEQLAARVADMVFVLDEVERRAAARDTGLSRLRLDAIGASGHSFGARTVQALASGSQAEPRFKAFVALSPSPDAVRPGAVTRPMLCVSGSLDGQPGTRPRSGEHRLAVYDALPPGRRALLWLDGADHMTFAGNAAHRIGMRFGPLKRERDAAKQEDDDHAIVARVTTAWWREHLQSDVQALRTPPALRPSDRWRRD